MDNEEMKRIRGIRGITQSEAAKYVGVSRQAFSNYERGQRVPSVDVLIKLAELYQVSLDELVGYKTV